MPSSITSRCSSARSATRPIAAAEPPPRERPPRAVAQPRAALGPRDHRRRLDRHVVLLQLAEQPARPAPARAARARRRRRALVGARRRVLPGREVLGRSRRAPPHAPLVQVGGVRDLAHGVRAARAGLLPRRGVVPGRSQGRPALTGRGRRCRDRKSTRLNSSHLVISYAVFCLKKKKKRTTKVNVNYTTPRHSLQ